MSSRTNLIIKDRAATPVSHTYSPDGDDTNGVHHFSEKTSVPAGNPRASVSLKSSNGKYRPTLRLSIPVVQNQVINGVSSPVIVRTARIEVSATFDALSSTQERADTIGLLVDCLSVSQTQINDLFVNLSDIY